MSLVTLTMSYQMPFNIGIIQAGGSTRYVMILDLISMWVIVIPLSCLLAFKLRASTPAVVWCPNSDQVFKCLPSFIKCNFGQWAKKLTED